MNNNAFYNFQENRAQAGYKSAIVVKQQEDTKYSLLIASETVPTIFGTVSSFEYDLLNSPTTGKIEGKSSLEEKEVECLLHRDNIWRFEQLRGKILDFMYVTPDFVGYKFTGTVSFRPNDAGADVLRGTYTIVPMSADDTPIYNVRDMVQETLCFDSAIPENINSGDKINLSVAQKSATVTYKQFNIGSDGSKGVETDIAVENGQATITLEAGGLIGITASADGYASWTTTVYVNAKA